MISTKSSLTDSENEQKHWKDRIRVSVSSIASSTNIGISVSEAGEESECCCCVNWFHDRQSKLRSKKQMKHKSKQTKSKLYNDHKKSKNYNMNMFNFKGEKLMIEIPRSDAVKLKNIFKYINLNGINRKICRLANIQLHTNTKHKTQNDKYIFLFIYDIYNM